MYSSRGLLLEFEEAEIGLWSSQRWELIKIMLYYLSLKTSYELHNNILTFKIRAGERKRIETTTTFESVG